MLENNETNIQYAAAYLKYMKDEWIEVYPEVETDIGIQATLYNLGHEKLREGGIKRILGILFEGFKDKRVPHENPVENYFGNAVIEVYELMTELLNEGNCDD